MICEAEQYKQFSKKSFNALDICIYGKLEYNYVIANKKALFANMSEYCTRLGTNVFNSVPLTFHVKDSIEHISF